MRSLQMKDFLEPAGPFPPSAVLSFLPQEILNCIIQGGFATSDVNLESFWPHDPSGSFMIKYEARHGQSPMTASISIARVIWWSKMVLGDRPVLHPRREHLRLGTPVTAIPHQNLETNIIKWSRLASGWVKLNVDGSSKGNPGLSGGGGICRGDNGYFIFAFSSGYGTGTNNRVEMRAIFNGLTLCLEKGLDRIEIESDSKLVIDLLSGKPHTPWLWRYWISRINKLRQGGTSSLRLIHREGNGPVDCMAREGSNNQTVSVIDYLGNLRDAVRGLLFLDKVGLGAVRRSHVGK
ncbi:uncharacterized protein LOC131220191 [Magnolia sinica]|uniref:uncharacterized protein LOC131220191 n=1 Tax=Magnolia sinica TaxID=86752 RepID=UPI002657AE20|nr:uncharacterized protein LOC131220191 [Magnolia sinica]